MSSSDVRVCESSPEASKQLQLFGTFLGAAHTLSNTIELWDAIPRYAVSLRRQAEVRDANGRLPVHRQRFFHARFEYELAIQPAAVGGPVRADVDFYPSADDELVEDVLRKLFVDQRQGVHDAAKLESWVSFTLQQVRRELIARGHTRSLDEIKQALAVLSRAILMVYRPGAKDPVYSSAVLMELVRIDRQGYLDDPAAQWRARLPLLMSSSINELSYRQFNYGVLMALPTPFARWLHKRLSHTYTNASMVVPYTVLLSTLVRDSGMFETARKTRASTAVASALQSLVEHGVLRHWEVAVSSSAHNRPRDLKYTLYPALRFVHEMTVANARTKRLRELQGKRPR